VRSAAEDSESFREQADGSYNVDLRAHATNCLPSVASGACVAPHRHGRLDALMGSLKKRRKAKISKHKRRKRMKENRHKKRLRYKS